MASLLYHTGLKALLDGTITFTGSTIKAMLVTADYEPSVAHQYVSSITGGATNHELTGTGYTRGFGQSGRKTLASKTCTVDATNARIVFDAADLTWTALTAGTVAAVVLVYESVSDAASSLIAYCELAQFATDGTDFSVTWHDTKGCFYLGNTDPNALANVTTPTPATATWKLASPAGALPVERLLLGPLTFPLVAPTTGGTLVTVGDPFLDVALPYYQHVLNYYLASAYAAAMSGQALAASNKACVETLPIDPFPYLGSRAIRFPFLAMFPIQGTAGERTLQRRRVASTYQLVWMLPALNFEQACRIHPILTAALKVLHEATEQQGLSHYNSGEPVWPSLRLNESVSLKTWTIGTQSIGNADIIMDHPTLVATVEVVQVSSPDPNNGQPFWGMTLALSQGDEGQGEVELHDAAVETTE